MLELTTAEAQAALPKVVVPVAFDSNRRPALEPALRSAFHHCLHTDASTLTKILEMCREQELLAAFQAEGCRDLRAMRPIFVALIAELEASQDLVEAMGVEHIFQTADTLLALQVSLLKKNLAREKDAAAIAAFWESQLANQASTLGASLFLPASWPASSKKDGGPVVAVLLQLLKWIFHIKDVVTNWEDMIGTVVSEAANLDKVSSLRQALMANSECESMLTLVLERLAGVSQTGAVRPPKSSKHQVCKKVEPDGNATNLPPYQSDCTVSWISGDEPMTELRQHW